MKRLTDLRLIAILLAVPALLVAACGGDDDSASTDVTGSGFDDIAPDEATAESGVDATPDDPAVADESADADDESGDDASDTPSDGGGCTVDVSGDVTASWTGPDDVSSVGTDYWMNEDELRETYELLASDDDPAFDDAQASGDPILAILLMNCVGDDGSSVSLFNSDSASFDDIPQASGSYPISSDVEATPASFGVVFFLQTEEDSVFQPDDAGGSIEFDEWTDDRVRGRFTFGIEEGFVDTPRTATVTGIFDFTN